ncbi:MAG: GAF domain-containing protein, partial [Verrucomicrobiota bacterium]
MSLSTFPSQVVRGSEPEEDVLGSIQRIGRTLSPEENLRRQVQVFIEEATAITGAQCGAVFQSTATAGNELLALLGMSEETFSRLWTPRMASILHGAGTIHGDDIAMEPMEEGDAPVVSRMVIPLVSRSGEVLGGLFFGHCEPARFTGREEKIAVVLAAQVVLAIENARLSNLLQQAGRELEFSEQRYHFLAEAIPQLVWTAHPDGRVDYFNRRWDEYVGTAPGASLGTRWIEYLHPEDRQRAMEAWENALQTTHPYESEYRLMRHDQVSRWHIARALCLRDENGRIMKWFGTCTDVHDQKAVASNNAFLANASVVLSSTLAHAEVLEKIVHLAVPHFSDWCTVEVLGVEGGETRVMRAHRDPEKMALVEEVARLYPEKPDAPFGSPRVLRTGKGEYGALVTDAMLAAVAHDARHLELLRSLRFYSYICVPLRARGKLLGTMYFISAESKRIFTQKDLESAEDFAHRAAEAIENARLYEEAHAANRAKDNFLAILSHELRTPLTPVMAGIARLLESE